jgi:hypothetical protein
MDVDGVGGLYESGDRFCRLSVALVAPVFSWAATLRVSTGLAYGMSFGSRGDLLSRHKGIIVTAWLRRWRRNPLLAAHHIATITLGMASVTAVVSLMLAMAFRPLPFRQSAQLVELWNQVQSGAPFESLSGSELIEIEEQTGDVFASLGGFTPLRLWLLDEQGSSEPLRVVRLEEAVFRALDITPVLGPSPAGSRASPAGLGPVWISHRLWLSRYGGRTSVVGEPIRLAQNEAGRFETRSEIAGVLPPGIQIPQPVGSGPVDLMAAQRSAPEWLSVAASDPAGPIALAFTILLSTALAGAYLPARSATRITSIAALLHR